MHHQGEVVVSIDGAADAFIVVYELLKRHNSVCDLGVPLRHEICIDLIWGLLAINYIWVLTGIIDLCDVSKFDQSILVHVKFVIGKFDPFLSLIIDISLYLNTKWVRSAKIYSSGKQNSKPFYLNLNMSKSHNASDHFFLTKIEI